MNLHVPTQKMKTGRGGRLIIYSSLPAEALSAPCLTFQASYVLALISIPTPIADLGLLNSIMNKIFALHVFNLHTPMHYTAILSMPILSVPTLIGFLN